MEVWIQFAYRIDLCDPALKQTSFARWGISHFRLAAMLAAHVPVLLQGHASSINKLVISITLGHIAHDLHQQREKSITLNL